MFYILSIPSNILEMSANTRFSVQIKGNSGLQDMNKVGTNGGVKELVYSKVKKRH